MEINHIFNYQPNTSIHLRGVTSEHYIRAEITHSYGFYKDGEKTKENVGFRAFTIKTINLAYAKKRAIAYFRTYF